MKPYKIIPLRNGDFKQVIAWSKEERISKNGSYEKLDQWNHLFLVMMEKLKVLSNGKQLILLTLECHMEVKFFRKEKNSNTGRPFFF